MKNLIVLLFAATLGFGMAAHAADAEIKVSAKQLQIKKLRAQADSEHKKGDALTAKADKLESETNTNPEEKMRGGRCSQHPRPPRQEGEAACVIQQ